MTPLDWLFLAAVVGVFGFAFGEWTRGRGRGWERAGSVATVFHLVMVTFPFSILFLLQAAVGFIWMGIMKLFGRKS